MTELQQALLEARTKRRKQARENLIIWFHLNMQGIMWGNSDSIRRFVKKENR